MPQDSKRKRHLRRVRRDRSLAYRMVNQLLAEREMSRKIITGMAATIEKLETPQNEALVEALVQGHGDGQTHTIEDVNAGRIDDLIAPRLEKARRETPRADQTSE